MLCFRKDTQWPKDFNPALLVCGLDNAGKSTIICRICNDTSDPTPTVGFVPHTVKMHGKSIRLYDVGGGERIRGIWESYFEEVYGVIYVFDSTDATRLSESVDLLKSMHGNQLLLRKPFLILANKQDTNGALNQQQLSEKLSLSEEADKNVHFEECSAIKSTTDKSIKDGLMWMLKYIYDNYDELLVKVSGDCAVKEQKKKIEREQRQARIKKAREEREKEEAAKKETEQPKKEEESGEDDLVCSPFKPIVKQAFTEDVLSSPEPPLSDGQKTPNKKKKKKKRKGNKVTPIHSNEGSLMSLASNNSIEAPKLAPVLPKSSLPCLSPSIVQLERSSLPPIKNAPIQTVVKDNCDVQKVQLSDLVKSEKNDAKPEISVPGIFGNSYVEVEGLEQKPALPMEQVHTIKLDRTKFLENVQLNG